MVKKKIKNIMAASVLALAAACAAFATPAAYAECAGTGPATGTVIYSGATAVTEGAINISLQDFGTPMGGVQFDVYKLADYDNEKGYFKFDPCWGVTTLPDTNSGTEALVKTLVEGLKGSPVTSGATDDCGHLSFQLPLGVYLVVPSNTECYADVSAFLVPLPYGENVAGKGDELFFTAEVEPKATMWCPTPTPTPTCVPGCHKPGCNKPECPGCATPTPTCAPGLHIPGCNNPQCPGCATPTPKPTGVPGVHVPGCSKPNCPGCATPTPSPKPGKTATPTPAPGEPGSSVTPTPAPGEPGSSVTATPIPGSGTPGTGDNGTGGQTPGAELKGTSVLNTGDTSGVVAVAVLLAAAIAVIAVIVAMQVRKKKKKNDEE